MTKRAKRKKPPTVPADYRPPPDPPTAEQRIAVLETKLAALEEVIASHKNALDVYPKLADWCDLVQKDLATLFENDQSLRNAVVASLCHTHPFVLLTQ